MERCIRTKFKPNERLTRRVFQNIAARAKKCIQRHDFGTVLVIFPIFKQLRALKPDFERTIEQWDLNVKQKFESILQMLQTTVSQIGIYRHEAIFAMFSGS